MRRVVPTCVRYFNSGNLSSCHVPSTALGAGDAGPVRPSPWEVKTLKGAGRGRLPGHMMTQWGDRMLAGSYGSARKCGR